MRGILNNGDTLTYAFGNTVTTSRGLRVTEHGGSMMGYKAYVLRFPDQHLSVMTTCNLGAIDPGPLAHAVAAVFLGSKMTPETPRTVAQSAARQAGASSVGSALTSADVAALTGDYFSDDLGVTYRVRADGDGRLMLAMPGSTPQPLIPTGPNAFRSSSTIVRFERPTEGSATAMTLTVSRIGEMRLGRR
jgi:hypothetical protein